jgi:hypothetical protein
MKSLLLDIEFTSAQFLPFLPEACQVNPGVYGFELALWLSQALSRAKLPTSYPMSEDWGWFIEFIDGDAEFMIGCASQAAPEEGYTGRPIAWQIFLKQHLSLKQRFMRSTAPDVAATLTQAILTALRAEGIEPNIIEAA